MNPLAALFFIGMAAQAAPPAQAHAEEPVVTIRPQPVYHIDVVQRSVYAVNYSRRPEPTKVDLKGTVLAPDARGEAKVQANRGATEIEARVERLLAPNAFGNEYLTYVLWAISPEGRPVNLGELILDPGNKARIKVSSDLQAFALIVTAEPYFSVNRPSDVVVMENFIRHDTVGKLDTVSANYELMPRGRYTYNKPPGRAAQPAGGEKLSMDQYEVVLALYQALNAIQIARAAGADATAGEIMRKADRLYEDARGLQSRGAPSSDVIAAARHAAQTAEDARVISTRRTSTAER
jgi:hypothetical protein